MEPKKEEWINDILASLNGVQRAEPNPFLFAKIQNRLTARQTPIYVPKRTVWIAAASFVVLALLNWQVYTRLSGSGSGDATELTSVVRDMGLYPASNQLYDVWNGQNY